MGHLTFLSKRLSAVGNKRIRNSLLQHVSCVHGSLLLSIPRGVFSVAVVLLACVAGGISCASAFVLVAKP